MSSEILDLVLKISEDQGKFNSGVLDAIERQQNFSDGQLEVNVNILRCIEYLDQRITELEKMISEQAKSES